LIKCYNLKPSQKVYEQGPFAKPSEGTILEKKGGILWKDQRAKGGSGITRETVQRLSVIA